ncbi:MAG: thiamine pyrophosphate-dependent enzyme [Caldisericia bacterium]|jgi:2-oxoglutarate ferredoxin oxidoreductase subunit beta|nr:thiamine pyrophosphate-dependent enzyme [Caldisericia bacterium]
MNWRDYLDLKKLPTIFCPGCGLGVGLRAILEAFAEENLNKNDLIFVSGIGCSSRIPGYVDFDSVHTIHGRAIAFATGIKLTNPNKHVFVITGDGDGLAIGGNHMIHAARRNLNINVFLFNNMIYGMTGGQASPTTPQGIKTSTSPLGKYEPNFDVVKLLIGAGATFVARGSVYYYNHLVNIIKRSIKHRGFSFVEILSPCPTYYGKYINIHDPSEFFVMQKDLVYRIEQSDKISENEKKNKLPIGIFIENTHIDYETIYKEIHRRLNEKEFPI